MPVIFLADDTSYFSGQNTRRRQLFFWLTTPVIFLANLDCRSQVSIPGIPTRSCTHTATTTRTSRANNHPLGYLRTIPLREDTNKQRQHRQDAINIITNQQRATMVITGRTPINRTTTVNITDYHYQQGPPTPSDLPRRAAEQDHTLTCIAHIHTPGF
jgi:hypothetical protein